MIFSNESVLFILRSASPYWNESVLFGKKSAREGFSLARLRNTIRCKNSVDLVFRQGVDDGGAVGVAYSDERPVDAIEDGAAVGVALVHEAVIVDSGDDGSEVGVAGMDESVHVNRRHNRRAVGVALADEAPTFPIAIVRFVVVHSHLHISLQPCGRATFRMLHAAAKRGAISSSRKPAIPQPMGVTKNICSGCSAA